MKTYGMNTDKYRDIWRLLQNMKDKQITHQVLDRWLSIYHGLQALADECDEDGRYPFMVLDEKKLTMFLLRWS